MNEKNKKGEFMNLKQSVTKKGAWQLIAAAFVGGVILSLVELYTMMQHKEKADLFFFGGMLIAGIFGTIGYFLTNAENIRSAIMNGVGAPQLLGGLAKAASATTGVKVSSLFPYPTKVIVTLLFPFISNTYAATPTRNVQKIDSVNVIISVEGIQNVSIQAKDSTYIISGLAKLTIPKQDSLIVYGNDIQKQTVILFKVRDKLKEKVGKDKKEFLMKINVQEIQVQQESKSQSIFRGMFAQEQKVEEKQFKKVDIKLE
jgi:hypothetical protein